MTKVANARKVFKFVIEIAGVNQFEVQKVTRPDIEVEVTPHGDTNHDVKTAGRVKVGEMTFEKIKPLTSDRFIWDWLISAQNVVLGTGGTAVMYKRTVIVKEIHPTTNATINRWVYGGVWCSKCSESALDRMSSDNIIQTATLQVDVPEFFEG